MDNEDRGYIEALVVRVLILTGVLLIVVALAGCQSTRGHAPTGPRWEMWRGAGTPGNLHWQRAR